MILPSKLPPKIKKWPLLSLSTAALAVILIAILIDYGIAIDGHRLGSDAAQNIRSAVNLARFGEYGEGPIAVGVEAGFRREPFPNFLLALYLKFGEWWLPGLLNVANDSLFGSFLFFAKTINMVVAAFLFGGFWMLLRQIFLSPLLANLSMLLLLEPLSACFVSKEINNLNTELIASSLIIWLTVSILALAQKISFRIVISCGFLFGLLALTKASAAYIAILALPCLAYLLANGAREFWRHLLFLFLGFSMLVFPWVLRNHFQFGYPVISRGGGDVLLIRTEFNQMNDLQFRNGFYAYSPKYLQDQLSGPLLGLDKSDFECGGSLEVYNRKLKCDVEALQRGDYDDVRSFYQRGKRAIRRKFGLNDKGTKKLAIERIKSDPTAHLRMTLLMGWRGYWPFVSKNHLHVAINCMAFLSLLLVPLIGMLEGRKLWVLIGILPSLYFAFYAFASHFLPRYSEPLIPVSLICLAISTVYVGNKLLCFQGAGCSLNIIFK